ncbi:MAG: hypothetical protein HZB51_34570 [Chloroflexi bacterium]|nr:hypothetical protein [Chloroflexota bacterium]
MSNEIDLHNYIDVLIRRWQIILAMPVLAIIVAVGVTFAIKPTYEATTTLALAPSTVSISLSNQLPPYYLMVDSPRHLPTAYTPTYYIAILKGADVVNAAKPRATISISADSGDRSLIAITARSDDPKIAVESANNYANASAERIRQLLTPNSAESTLAKQKLDAAQQALDQFMRENNLVETDPSAATGLSLDKRKQFSDLSRARDLADSVHLDLARNDAISAILADTSLRPTIIAASVPTAPVSPKLNQNILIGAAIGLLIGILGAFTLELTRRKE